MRDKPFSQACENNKDPILEVLTRAFVEARRILEIGSGTGQHAVYFAAKLQHLVWLTSDLKENHAGILAWMEAHPSANLMSPWSLMCEQSAGRWTRSMASLLRIRRTSCTGRE